eukprot:364847-Chlamydomonas_euryale.AAC.8
MLRPLLLAGSAARRAAPSTGALPPVCVLPAPAAAAAAAPADPAVHHATRNDALWQPLPLPLPPASARAASTSSIAGAASAEGGGAAASARSAGREGAAAAAEPHDLTDASAMDSETLQVRRFGRGAWPQGGGGAHTSHANSATSGATSDAPSPRDTWGGNLIAGRGPRAKLGSISVG